MRKVALIVAIVPALACAGEPVRQPVYKPPVRTSDAPVISDEAKAAFNNWHLAQACEIPPPGMPAGYLAQFGSRRFAGSTIKWRIASGSQNQQYATSAPFVMGNLASRLSPWASVVQTTSGDGTAQITFKTGTSFVAQNGQTIPVLGCAANPIFANFAQPNTLSKVDVYCIPGAAGNAVLTHEVEWHGFFTWCHANGQVGCGTQSANQLPPANGDCIPGQAEAVRWIYQVPPGSFPQ